MTRYLPRAVTQWANFEKALEDDKVTDAVISEQRSARPVVSCKHCFRDGQKTVYVTDVNEAIELLEKYDIDPTMADVPKGHSVFMTEPFFRPFCSQVRSLCFPSL